MMRWLCVLSAAVLLGGCVEEPGVMPEGPAVQRSDAAEKQSADLTFSLVRSFDQAGLAAMVGHLADPNERLALAAARSAGRWPIRKDAKLSQAAADALAEAIGREHRPAVLEGQVAALANLLANRQGLGEPLASAKALPALRALADRPDAGPTAVMAGGILATWANPRRASLGENVYDGAGWSAALPKPLAALPPAAAYPEPLHSFAVVAAGELHVGDLTGDGAADYLIVDRMGRGDGLYIRMSIYGHDGKMIWQEPLAGEERPIALPPGPLGDVDGDGRAEIVYLDRASRVVIRDGFGKVLRRSDTQRTLNGTPYAEAAETAPNGKPPTRCGIRLLSFRGRGMRDVVLTNDAHALALTGQLQLLWHVCLPLYGRADEPTVAVDFDADGRQELVRGNVAIGHDGRVLWTWPTTVAAALVADFGKPHGRQVVLADEAGTVVGFDAGGMLWQVAGRAPIRDLLVGRFAGPLAGARIGFVRMTPGQPTPQLLNGAGGLETGALRRLARQSQSPVEFTPSGAVADSNGDGIDEVWGRERGGLEFSRWFKWPVGPAVGKLAVNHRQVELPVEQADVNGDGRPELLYFQGKTLVVVRR